MADFFQNLPMKIGRIISALRKDRNLTQEEVALEAETNAAHISRIERGDRQPSLAMLEDIARALGTTVSSICVAAEGLKREPHAPKGLQNVTEADLSDDALAFRGEFRKLTKANQRIAVELVRALVRTQQ